MYNREEVYSQSTYAKYLQTKHANSVDIGTRHILVCYSQQALVADVFAHPIKVKGSLKVK